MDVVLRTNTEVPHLALLNVEYFGDESGYGAQLVVRSRGFVGAQQLYFERESLEAFLEGVERMDRTLDDSARLQPFYEEAFVALEVDRAGAVYVRGELLEYGEFTHRLSFGFRTDQTCLAPLAAALRACLRLAAV